MSKYYSINEFSKILGISAQTLRNWDKNGKLHLHHASNNGHRYYSQREKLVKELIGDGSENNDKNNSSNVTTKQQTKN